MSITWTVTIDPGQNRELVFVAKNPNDATEIVWRAHQRYADGTSSEWVNPNGSAGARRLSCREATGQLGGPVLYEHQWLARRFRYLFDHQESPPVR